MRRTIRFRRGALDVSTRSESAGNPPPPLQEKGKGCYGESGCTKVRSRTPFVIKLLYRSSRYPPLLGLE